MGASCRMASGVPSLLCFASFISLQSGQFQVFGHETPSPKFEINITADNNFTLYDSFSTIGNGSNLKEVFTFSLQDPPRRLFVDAGNTGGPQWLILETPEGLVSNASWRCVSNEDSSIKPPF